MVATVAMMVSLAACGDASDVQLAGDAQAEASLSTRSDRIACYAASEDERTAAEIARLTQARATSPSVLAYAKGRRAAHEALYQALRDVGTAEHLPVSRTMSPAGEKLWGALFNHSGERYEGDFFTLQAQMQRDTLTHLRGLRAEVTSPALQAWLDRAIDVWQAEPEAMSAAREAWRSE
jgi:predicted outer membrane protein